MFKKITSRILSNIKSLFNINNDLFIQNINKNIINKNQKSVLISYLTSPLLKDINSEDFNKHTNYRESLQIIKSFIDFNYKIDLIDVKNYKDIKKIYGKKYDVIFGFDKPFYYASKENPQAKKIIYLTELHPNFSKKQEKERNRYFFERHKKRIELERSGTYYDNKQLGIADYGILFGNDYTVKTYKEFNGEIFTISPTALINSDYNYRTKTHSITKKNFLWFGSRGAIHKGLDLLIDAFSDLPEYNLYICGLKNKDRNLLNLKPENIFDLGFINVESDEFINLIENCSYVIMPSCSEGMSTGVLTLMFHGLIPIITRETGITLNDFGFYIEDYRIDNIKKKIDTCANIDESQLIKMQKKVFEYSRREFTLEKFTNEFKIILSQILKQ